MSTLIKIVIGTVVLLVGLVIVAGRTLRAEEGYVRASLRYLAPYVFRVAIGDHRIVSCDDGQVTRPEATASGRGPKELRAIRRESSGRSSSTRHPERECAMTPAGRPRGAFLERESTAGVGLIATPPPGATSRRRPPW